MTRPQDMDLSLAVVNGNDQGLVAPPTSLPPAMAVAVAQEAGRRRAAVVRAHAVLGYAAVGCLDEDQAVAYAKRLLRLQVAPR